MFTLEFSKDKTLGDILVQYENELKRILLTYKNVKFLKDILEKPEHGNFTDCYEDEKYKPSMYYICQFIFELLMREDDLIDSNSSSRFKTLGVQLFYELFILGTLFGHYQSWDVTSRYDNRINFNNPGHDQLVEQIQKYKNTLLQKCKLEQITPVRALFLFVTDCTSEEISSVLSQISNRYITASLMWIVGFKGFKKKIEVDSSQIINISALFSGSMFKRYYDEFRKYTKINYGKTSTDYEIYTVMDMKYHELCRKDINTCDFTSTKQYLENEKNFVQLFTYHPFYMCNTYISNMDVYLDKDRFERLEVMSDKYKDYYYSGNDEMYLDKLQYKMYNGSVDEFSQMFQVLGNNEWPFSTEYKTAINVINKNYFKRYPDDIQITIPCNNKFYNFNSFRCCGEKMSRSYDSEAKIKQNFFSIVTHNFSDNLVFFHGEYGYRFNEEKNYGEDYFYIIDTPIITCSISDIFEKILDEKDKQIFYNKYPSLKDTKWNDVCSYIKKKFNETSTIKEDKYIETKYCEFHIDIQFLF